MNINELITKVNQLESALQFIRTEKQKSVESKNEFGDFAEGLQLATRIERMLQVIFLCEHYLEELTIIEKTSTEKEKCTAVKKTINSVLTAFNANNPQRRKEFSIWWLFSAIDRGDIELFEALLKAGADVNSRHMKTPHQHTKTPLVRAIAKRYLPPRTPEQQAYNRINLKMIESLIEQGADPNIMDDDAQFNAFMQVVYADDLRITKLLIGKTKIKIDINKIGKWGTALHIACQGNVSFELFKLLLEQPDIDVNASYTPCGENVEKTVLSQALETMKIQNENCKIETRQKIIYLLRDPKIKKTEHDFHVAIESGFEAVSSMLLAGYQIPVDGLTKVLHPTFHDPLVIDLIVGNSDGKVLEIAKKELISWSTCTELMFYATLGNTEKLNEVLRSLTPKALQSSWSGALFKAAQLGRTEVVRLLLAAPNAPIADINDPLMRDYEITMHNLTPLMAAAKYGRTEIVKMLVKRGADVNRKMSAPPNVSALSLAIESGHAQTSQYLLRIVIDTASKIYVPQASGPSLPLTPHIHSSQAALFKRPDAKEVKEEPSNAFSKADRHVEKLQITNSR